MKKAFPIALMIFGLVFIAAGVYTVSRGYDARKQVRAELLAQHITTTPDAAIPNVPVQDAKTARSWRTSSTTTLVRRPVAGRTPRWAVSLPRTAATPATRTSR